MGPGVRRVPEDLPITVDSTRQDLCEETPEIPHAHRPWPVATNAEASGSPFSATEENSKPEGEIRGNGITTSRAADGIPRFQLIVPRIGLFL